MNFKVIIQLILFIIGISFVIYVNSKYFKKTELKKNNEVISNSKSQSNNTKNENTLKNIFYEKYDKENNKYIITSETGFFLNNNNENVYLENVKAFLILNNNTTVYLKSDKANYNTITNESHFYENVNANYLNHKLNSSNLHLDFYKNLLLAYDYVIYTSDNYKLLADKAQLNLLTKDLKIFMLSDELESKVKVFNVN